MQINIIEKFFRKLLELRAYVLFAFGVVSIFGIYSISKIKIDAIPDITNKQVIVNTKTFGIDPAYIEKSITYPIESELFGVPKLKEMRSLSKFGLSQIILIFEDDVDIYFARAQVLQRLSSLKDQLPPNISPAIAPITTGIGEIIIYRVINKNNNENDLTENDLMEIRAFQEFKIARELKRVQGVAEIDTIGGFERQIHLNLIPQKIIAQGLTAKKIIAQIQSIGENFGGGYIEKDNQQKIVRTFANIRDQNDLMNVPIKIDYLGKAIPLHQIVEVRQDYSQLLGSASVGGKESIIGTVMLQSGSNSNEVLTKVKQEINKINERSSKFKIELLYDRQFLIDKTIKTVLKNLTEGILLVVVVLCFALGTLKSGMIVASTIIFSVLILTSCMNLFDISANLMSLGAIDFGLLVDSSVVLVEYIICHLHFSKKDHHKIENIAQLSSEVFKPIFVGMFIIILVYVPILMFSGIEGKTFNQMALNVIIAMLSSIIVAFLLMPILCFYFINKNTHKENKFFTIFTNFYRKILKLSLNNPNKIIILCFVIFIFSLTLFTKIESDFLPDLNEGDIVLTIVAPDGSSLSSTKKIAQNVEKIISQNSQIDKTFARIGSSQSGLDPMPQNIGDIFIILKESEKINAKFLAKNYFEQAKKLCLECEFSLSQPIKMRFNEMLEGSRADLSLKIFGEDFEKLLQLTEEIKNIISQDKNLKSVEKDFLNSIRKGAFIDVIPDYNSIAKHQINIFDVNSEVSNAMVGARVGTFYNGEFPISIVLHLNEENRNKLDSIENIPITLKDGGSFPLKTVATVKENNDITSIPRIFGKRYSSLSIYLENTNYAEFIEKIEAQIKERKMLPDGYLIEWGGRFENFNNGKKQILTIVPFIIFLIAFLLYKIFGKIKKVLIIFSSVPFALSGAIFLIYLCKIPITISVYIGFIALVGIGLLNSIILISTFKKNRNIEESCISRLRPILMTAFVASLGFLPMAFSRGIGAEVQQPIAITVIGGIIFSTIATLILSPVLIKKTSKDF